MQMQRNHGSFPCMQLSLPPSPSSSSSPSSEYPTLESSILRVVHQDAGDDGVSSAVTTVTRELLQEAAEHVGAALGETLGGKGGTGKPPSGGSNGPVKEDTQIR